MFGELSVKIEIVNCDSNVYLRCMSVMGVQECCIYWNYRTLESFSLISVRILDNEDVLGALAHLFSLLILNILRFGFDCRVWSIHWYYSTKYYNMHCFEAIQSFWAPYILNKALQTQRSTRRVTTIVRCVLRVVSVVIHCER